MDVDHKILRFNWMGKEVDIGVDPEKCSLLDIVLEYEDEVKMQGIRMDYGYPCFSYVWKMDHRKLITDNDLVLMFERNVDQKLIYIWIGTSMMPDDLYKLVLNFRRRSEMSNAGVNKDHEHVLLDQLEDTILNNLESQKTKATTNPEIQKTTSKKGKKPLQKQPKKKSKTAALHPPPPISPQTAFKSLTVRRSPRFSPPQITSQNDTSNSTLGIDRCRPVLTLLEGIRRVCMVRIATRNEAALSWNDDELCPKIVKLVTKISKDIISCKAYMSKPGEYEIHEGKSHFPLSLNNKVCSCGAWQISGIPCRHAIRAMLHAKIDPQKIVSSWYHVRTYKQTYSFSINPVPDKDQWPTYENLPILKPPTIKRGVGRPSRNRRREEGENQKEKRSKTVKCTKCLCFGHNARTCKGGLTAKEKKDMNASGLPPVVRNPRVRNQAKASSKTAKNAAEKPASVATGGSQSSINMSQFPDSQSQQA